MTEPVSGRTLPRELAYGFRGPRPGSNLWTYLRLPLRTGDVMGDDIDAWIREGLFTAEPVAGEPEVLPAGPSQYGDLPDVEMTHIYSITPAGERRLAHG